MQLFLHLGYAKTGSTAIQNCLARNRDYIESHDACLPIPPSLLNDQTKGRVRAGNGQNLKEAISSGSINSVVDLIKHDIDSKECYNKLIYSSETLFYRLANLDSFRLLKNAINILGFSEIKILLYVRNPASHAISWHGELVKVGLLTKTISEYMYDYKFPAGAVRLLKYVDEISDDSVPVRLELHNYSCLHNKVLEVAWNWLGIPSPIDTLCLNNHVNRSLTASEAEFCLQLAKAGCNPSFISRSLTTFLPNIKPGLSKPTLESVNNMYSRNFRDLEFLNNFLPGSEHLSLSVADENVETYSSPIDEFTFSTEQLIQIAQVIAPLLKVSHPLSK